MNPIYKFVNKIKSSTLIHKMSALKIEFVRIYNE